MTDQAIIRTARSAVAIGGGLAIAGSTLTLASGELEFWWRSYSALVTLFATCFAVFIWVVIPRQPRNAAVWTMTASSFCGVTATSFALAARWTDGDPVELLHSTWVPADAPASVAWAFVIGNGASDLGLWIPLTFGLLLFPHGSLPSSRWRWVARIGAVSILVFAVADALWYLPSNESGDEGVALYVGVTGTFAVMALSLLGLVRRFRSSEGATRQQFKWIVFGAAICIPAFIAPAFMPEAVTRGDVTVIGVTLAVAILAICYGIAVGRYRLYDVEIVISRAVVLFGLAAFIGAMYVGVVVGLGSAFGGSSLWLSVVATALVAIVFEPLRARLQRRANRLVYGRKATPYEVLADVTEHLAESESGERLLRRLAAYLLEGTGGARAAVWVADDGLHRPVATAPQGLDAVAAATLEDLPGVCVPIEFESDVLGAITVEPRPGVALSAAEHRLVEDLAGSAALVVHKMQLDDALAARAEELRESRGRLLRAQDDQRRRLQHVLRDGVEGQVLSLTEGLDTARRLAVAEGSVRTADLIDEMTADAGNALDQIRSLAKGIYPPRLDTDGLGPAISEQAALCPLEVHAIVDVVHRHPQVVEGAVYFCVSEALTNASKYAVGPVYVTIADGDGDLTFEVTDSGPGFDPARRERGSGLANMADRLDALGGAVRVSSSPGTSTTISGTVPALVPTTRRPRPPQPTPR